MNILSEPIVWVAIFWAILVINYLLFLTSTEKSVVNLLLGKDFSWSIISPAQVELYVSPFTISVISTGPKLVFLVKKGKSIVLSSSRFWLQWDLTRVLVKAQGSAIIKTLREARP